MRRIYLDYNATAPLEPAVREAMLPWLGHAFGNPSSLHREGRAARRAVEDAREEVAALLAAEPDEIIFTSGATEANVTALMGVPTPVPGRPLKLALSAVEHPSVLGPAAALAAAGAEVIRVGVDEAGRLREAEWSRVIDEGVDLLVVMAANNEVGTVFPIERIAARAASRGVRLHVDAVQAVMKTGFSVAPIVLGSASVSAHKLGGPKGVGALFLRRESRLVPLLEGGGQERGRRGGTENVAAIVGFGEAARLARTEGAVRRRALLTAESLFLEAVRQCGVPFEVHGPDPGAERLPGTLSLRVPGVRGEAMMIGLDLAGVAVSLGSACSSGAAKPSPVLEAMGKSKVENLESFRVSLGWHHGDAELLAAAELLARVAIPKSNS